MDPGALSASQPLVIAVNGRFLTQPITGVQRYCHALLDAVDELLDEERYRGFSFRIYAPDLPRVAARWRNLTLVRRGRFAGHMWEQLLFGLIARGDWLFCPANTAPLVGLWGNRPVAVTLHSLSFRRVPAAYGRLFRALYEILVPAAVRRARLLFTVSESERAVILEDFPGAASRLKVTPLGGWERKVNCNRPPAAANAPFLFVGSFSPAKNFALVLSALEILRSRGLRPRLRVAGGPAASFARDDTGASGACNGQIEFLGQINDSHGMAELYASSRGLLFPSFYESAGLPASEAMACGCPVVVSAIPALQERCGQAALYIDPRDPAALADAIEQLMTDEALYQKLRNAGREQAEQWTWRRCAELTLAAFAEAAARDARS